MIKSYLSLHWHRVYNSYWFIPLFMSVVAMGLPYLTVQFEPQLQENILIRTFAWLNFSDRDVAHQLLTTVISSIINVISITFSLTMVVLTMAASQFGPQVLRNFMEDTATKFVLGTFVATFLYCLLTLRILGSFAADEAVPEVTIALALLFTIFSVGVLVFFIHHVSQCVQVDIIVRRLSQELMEAIEKLFPSKTGEMPEHADDSTAWNAVNNPNSITAEVGGYIQSISGDELIRFGADHECVVEVIARPGDFIVPGANLALVHMSGSLTDKANKDIRKLFVIGARRTPIQDIKYTLEKISEVALRALSPGVNEPYVAIKCIDYLSLNLTTLTNRQTPSSYRMDEEDKLRVIVNPVSFETIVDIAFDPIVHYAENDCSVIEAVIRALGAISEQNQNPHNGKVLKNYLGKLNDIIESRQWEANQETRLQNLLVEIDKSSGK